MDFAFPSLGRPAPAITTDTFIMDKICEKRISVVSSEATSSPDRPTLQLNDLEASEPNERSQSSASRAYLSVFGAFLALFCTFGDINSFGTFQAWYLTHQLHSMSPSAISWIGSVQLFIFFSLVSVVAFLEVHTLLFTDQLLMSGLVPGIDYWESIRRHRAEILDDHWYWNILNLHHASLHFS